MATPFDSNLSTPEHQIDPPLKTGFISSMVFAFAVHGLLVAALTWGVNWHQKAEITGVQAELWSAQNQESAPSAIAQNTPTPEQVEPPPPPPPPIEPEKKAEPIKTPVKPVEVDDEIKDAQIALEKAKKEKAKQDIEQEKKLKEKKEKEKAKAEQLEKEKQAEKNKLEQEKLDKAKANKEKEKLDKNKADKEKADKLAREKARQEQINRLKNQAGATSTDSGNTANGGGKNNGSGTAAQSSGPSAGYEGRVRARLKPNIVFTENINGNPSTEIEVRLAQDGMVLGKPKILRSSGVKSWDDAVVRAIEKTEIFPRDIDGKVPPVIIMTLRPRE
jgi:colicin import membrane protein